MRENFDDEGKEHLKTENKKKKRQIVITLMLMKKNS